ncbi:MULTISPECIES: YlbF family regulator [Exiguobacterium]|uniref:YlbF family regulator n=2 Tax=Exiguobacterium TaxID=33986 RepID=A0ABT7MK31_9BACL|nr:MULTISPECIES: YlbF family regulator [Exiguobacterium]KGI85043.1 regulator [Exiguobacterium mexicanum]MCT4778558.1 YlbF family regulator [Exiguobacterium aquaticum]MCT4789576.1 YlbF family regulator [Exiguobacterium mexicanum]MDL5375772.1 YlbF family regulator [Exiguobacterium mexicanum]RHB51215.1 YlbF family regulator [Exiguobacterium sp. AM39-5BH]
MIITEQTIALLDQTESLADLIEASESFQTYIATKQARAQSEEARLVEREFLRMKEDYEYVQRFGKHHPDHDRIKKEMHLVKRRLDVQPEVAAFKKAERSLDKLLGEVSELLAFSVSPKIKVPTGNPFFDEGGCSGGGSCGGGSCGCAI